MARWLADHPEVQIICRDPCLRLRGSLACPVCFTGPEFLPELREQRVDKS
ncbi:hypothetical protein [Streptomyces mangrovisoli]|nr:hypothetical protein [Streptomyces mangrovisoli]